MTINRIVFINEYGQTRLSRTYYDDGVNLSKDIIRKCLINSECHFIELDDTNMIVFRRYRFLMIIAIITTDENELAVYDLLDFIGNTIELSLKPFDEVRFMSNIDKVTMILDEIVLNGSVVEMSSSNALYPIQYIEDNKYSTIPLVPQ